MMRYRRSFFAFLVAAALFFPVPREAEAQQPSSDPENAVTGAESGPTDVDILLNQAEAMVWLGLAEKGNPRAFQEALHLVEQAKAVEERSARHDDLVSERIATVHDEAAFYLEYSSGRFFGAYPLARLISPALLLGAGNDVTEQLLEEPAYVAVRKAAKAIGDYMIGFDHPHVTFRSEPANRRLERVAFDVVAAAPRPYPHSRRELLDILPPDEVEAYDRGEISAAIADRLMHRFGTDDLLVVSIVQNVQLPDGVAILVEGDSFKPGATGPTNGFSTRGFARDRRDQLWPMIWTHVGLLMLAMALAVSITWNPSAPWPPPHKLVAGAGLFLSGRLYMVLVVVVLGHAIPDVDDMALTSWWWPAVLMLLAMCGSGVMAWYAQARVSNVVPGSRGSRAVGMMFALAALGATSYFVGPLLLLAQSRGFASFVPLILSSVALAVILGFAIRTGPPVPTYFSVIPAVATLPLGVAVMMASPRALWTMFGVSAAICLAAWVRHRHAVAHGTEESEPDWQEAQHADEARIEKIGKGLRKNLPV